MIREWIPTHNMVQQVTPHQAIYDTVYVARHPPASAPSIQIMTRIESLPDEPQLS